MGEKLKPLQRELGMSLLPLDTSTASLGEGDPVSMPAETENLLAMHFLNQSVDVLLLELGRIVESATDREIESIPLKTAIETHRDNAFTTFHSRWPLYADMIDVHRPRVEAEVAEGLKEQLTALKQAALRSEGSMFSVAVHHRLLVKCPIWVAIRMLRRSFNTKLALPVHSRLHSRFLCRCGKCL